MFSDVFGLYVTYYHIKMNLIAQKLSYLSDHKNNSVVSLHLYFEICGGFRTLESFSREQIDFALHVRAFNEASGEPTNVRSRRGRDDARQRGVKRRSPLVWGPLDTRSFITSHGSELIVLWRMNTENQENRFILTTAAHSNVCIIHMMGLLKKLLLLPSDWLI